MHLEGQSLSVCSKHYPSCAESLAAA